VAYRRTSGRLDRFRTNHSTIVCHWNTFVLKNVHFVDLDSTLILVQRKNELQGVWFDGTCNTKFMTLK
jgi:hypothetical protein